MLFAPQVHRTAQLNEILEHVGGALDISEELREEATRFYEAVGRHLARKDSQLFGYSPAIYPQGSFRLGTMVRPVTKGCDYDVDLVCVLLLTKFQTTQANLKELVGRELEIAYQAIMKEGRRCWTLRFNTRFHMDVLPSIPDIDLGGTSILLTDTNLTRWQCSDPKAYAVWFEAQMATVVAEMKEAAALRLRATVDQIPDWKIRTPLQRAVQILKRHRDLHFRNHVERRPASIIITTLAAQAYGGEKSIVDALIRISEELSLKAQPIDGYFYIPNPVNPKENFADRWNEDPERAKHFLNWVRRLEADLASWIGTEAGLYRLSESMGPAFGSDVVAKAFEDYGRSQASARAAGNMAMALGSGTLVRPTAPVRSVPVRNHTFFGE
jgi:hypothetical protein